jgi:hypothetical protein
MGAFWEKKSKNGRIAIIWKFMGGGCHFLNIGNKNANELIVQEGKMYFRFLFLKKKIKKTTKKIYFCL